MKDFYHHYQLNKYANITTGIDADLFFGNHFKTNRVPYVAIYGKDKKLKEVFTGNITSKQIKNIIEK
ncbi:hypothetical protein GCM10009415_37930 [Chitinophaga japonensis]